MCFYTLANSKIVGDSVCLTCGAFGTSFVGCRRWNTKGRWREWRPLQRKKDEDRVSWCAIRQAVCDVIFLPSFCLGHVKLHLARCGIYQARTHAHRFATGLLTPCTKGSCWPWSVARGFPRAMAFIRANLKRPKYRHFCVCGRNLDLK